MGIMYYIVFMEYFSKVYYFLLEFIMHGPTTTTTSGVQFNWIWRWWWCWGAKNTDLLLLWFVSVKRYSRCCTGIIIPNFTFCLLCMGFEFIPTLLRYFHLFNSVRSTRSYEEYLVCNVSCLERSRWLPTRK